MDEEAVPSGRLAGVERSLRVALAFCGILSILWLSLGDPSSPAARAAAGAIGGLSVISLAWQQRRRAGDASREAEVMAQQLVDERNALAAQVRELKSDHQALEHYFDALMQNIPSNLYFKDRNSCFLKVNQSMAESFDCGNPADLVGKTDHDFFDADHADPALADEKEILRTGRGIDGKIEYETFVNGRRGWVLTTKLPFRDRVGNIMGTFGISSDVTELMETKITLEKERNMLRSLIDSFPDKIFVRDPGRHYLVVNEAMAEWVGEDTPETMLGKTPEDYYSAEIIAGGALEDIDLLAGEKSVIHREWQMEDREGRLHHMVTTKAPWMDAEGRVLGIVGMDRDVTEEKEARTKLEETEALLQELMDNSPAVVYVKDLAGRYIMVNQGYEEMFGLHRSDVLGRTDHEFIADKEAADEFRKNDLEVQLHGKPIQIDEKLYVEGLPRWYVSVKFPLRDSTGAIHATAGISTDITDRKKAEVAMRKLNDELTNANENLKQAHEQLIQAEKMESIGRLASGVAHEVKNPLAMIGMGLELLGRRIPEDDQTGRETIERMNRGIDRAKNIVKGLVDFSSARQLEMIPSEPNQVVEDALALVEYQLKKGGVKVARDLATDLPLVEMDPTRIEQVLVNLIMNAMQAMGEGTLVIRTSAATISQLDRDEGARTARHLRAGDRVVRIEIEDSGPGIDSANMGKLYDPFFTTKPTGQGTGLGLSVSRKIIELHHGTLELMNRSDGKGALAVVELKALQQ